MKRIFIMVTLCLVVWFSLTKINVEGAQPAGKNLMDPDRFTVDVYGIETDAPIPVKPGTNYVLSMVDYSVLDEVHITVWSDHVTYIDEANVDFNQCTWDDGYVVCSFETSSTTDTLHINISGALVELYINYYGFSEFQLEEGTTRTNYEPFTPQPTVPEFQGSGTFINSYKTPMLATTIVGNYIFAYDEIDGDLSNQIIIETDAYSGNEAIVGVYEMLLSVTDSSDNTAFFTLVIHVIDDSAPEIIGPNIINHDVDSVDSLHKIIIDNFTFIDDYDGILSTYTILYDEFTGNASLLGEKSVTIATTDFSGNETQKTFTINVIDVLPPIISGPPEVTLMMSENPTIETLISLYTATDNHTPSDALTITIFTSEIPENFIGTGIFMVVLEVSDVSGNTGYYAISVTIYDDIAPYILGPTEYQTSYTQAISIETFLSDLNYGDNYAMLTIDDIIIHANTYHVSSTVPGHYSITFALSDENQTVFHTISIHVYDDVPPIFSFDSQIILAEGTLLTSQTLMNYVSSLKHVTEFNPIHIEIINEHAMNQALSNGVYHYYVRMINDQNEEHIEHVIVEVVAIPHTESVGSNQKKIVSIALCLGMGILFIGYKKLRK